MHYKKVFMALTATLVFSMSTVMAAPNFVLFYAKENVRAYVDPESLTYDGKIINSWLKLDIGSQSYVIDYLFNTEEKTMKAVKQRKYDSHKELGEAEKVNDTWEKIDKSNKDLYEKLWEQVKAKQSQENDCIKTGK